MTYLRNAASLQMERKHGFCFSTCRSPYDLVRYVDPITNKVIHIEKDGKMWESETACSDIWNCLEKCSNCISRLSMQTGKRMTKLEVAGDDPYRGGIHVCRD